MTESSRQATAPSPSSERSEGESGGAEQQTASDDPKSPPEAGPSSLEPNVKRRPIEDEDVAWHVIETPGAKALPASADPTRLFPEPGTSAQGLPDAIPLSEAPAPVKAPMIQSQPVVQARHEEQATELPKNLPVPKPAASREPLSLNRRVCTAILGPSNRWPSTWMLSETSMHRSSSPSCQRATPTIFATVSRWPSKVRMPAAQD